MAKARDWPTFICDPMQHQVYLITCFVTGKQYVGITTRPIQYRWIGHASEAKRKPRGWLALAIKEYGARAFEVRHIATALSAEDAPALEQALVTQYGTFHPAGYNATTSGSAKGFQHTDRSRKLISEASVRLMRPIAEMMRAQKKAPDPVLSARAKAAHAASTPEARARKSNKGRKATPETKAKMRAYRLAVYEEARQRGVWNSREKDNGQLREHA